MRARHIFIGLLLASGMPAGSLMADELRSAAERTAACRTIADPLERLACLDAAAADISRSLDAPAPVQATAPAAPPVPAVPEEPRWATAPAPPPDPAPVQEAASAAASGAAAEDRKPIWARIIPRREPGQKQIESIDVTVTRITRNNIGRYFFYTQDNGVWRQMTATDIDLPRTLPMSATIAKTGLGSSPSIRFADPSKHSYKVRRVE